MKSDPRASLSRENNSLTIYVKDSSLSTVTQKTTNASRAVGGDTRVLGRKICRMRALNVEGFLKSPERLAARL